MLRSEKVLITGPGSQVAFPIARELAKHNEVHGLARFSSPNDRASLEAVGVTCIAADAGWSGRCLRNCPCANRG